MNDIALLRRITLRVEQRLPAEVRPAPEFNPLVRQVAFGPKESK